MGKALAIIAGLLGLISIFLGFIIPDIGAWFRFEASAGGTVLLGQYINGLGIASIGGTMASLFGSGGSGIAMMELIGGIICLLGCLIILIGGAKESKGLGIVGGLLILMGPIILIVDMMVVSADTFNAMLALFGAGGQSILFGSITILGNTLVWGLWIGSFLALGAGVLGIIGGAML